jgi:hypothetical protein
MLGGHIFKVPQSKTPKPILQLPSQRRHKSERIRVSWSIYQEHVFLGMVFKLLNLSISLSPGKMMFLLYQWICDSFSASKFFCVEISSGDFM